MIHIFFLQAMPYDDLTNANIFKQKDNKLMFFLLRIIGIVKSKFVALLEKNYKDECNV